MKRPSKSGRYGKESERPGLIFSTQRTTPLAPWMENPALLPKAPPPKRREKETDERTEST